MRLSGVDPGIIRELSGIYKPFVKAFKELISNAYDADASNITVTLAEDFSVLEVLDDGIGMTPYAFEESFARLGGSTAWRRGGKSPKGRLRIGYKGIGFLAVARYCSALQVETHSRRPHRGWRPIQRRNRKTVPLDEVVGPLIPRELLSNRVSIRSIKGVSGSSATLFKEGRDYAMEDHAVRLIGRSLRAQLLEFDYEIDCSNILIEAVLDFDYLLSLERRADLRLLDDFCTVAFKSIDRQTKSHTRIRLMGLKDFVVRDLGAPRSKGKARNIAFKSGKEQFLWRLARTAPIRDALPSTVACEPVLRSMELQAHSDLPAIAVKWRSDDPVLLTRPIYVPHNLPDANDDTVIPVDIDEGGIRATGYLLARSEIVYPAELRGIAIRVRNVTIGDTSFLGWEHLLSGPRKAALSQISGELIVSKGLDAADAINPGRESFYEENVHYRILRRALFGSEETVGGLVGKAVRGILDRIHVRSQVTEKLAEARQRRRTLTEISSAVNFYSRERSTTGRALAEFFSRPVRADGLGSARDVPLRPGHKLGGFAVESRKGLASGDVEIDFRHRTVAIDFEHETWSTMVYLNGHYYEVLIKQGKPDHPICEFDNDRRRILVNWGHPVKLHMDDTGFLKSAILLRLAHYAAPANADTMMDLALNMLAFRAE
jgi:hypothetical protein